MINKVLLAVIALGLWANAATTAIRPARADNEYGYQIYKELRSINSTLGDIENKIGNTLDVNCRIWLWSIETRAAHVTFPKAGGRIITSPCRVPGRGFSRIGGDNDKIDLTRSRCWVACHRSAFPGLRPRYGRRRWRSGNRDRRPNER